MSFSSTIQQLLRAGFRMVIDSQPDLTVVGKAGDGGVALELLRRAPADVPVHAHARAPTASPRPTR
jgi:DNA-binding NarL/FixJ family response regulator